MGLLSAMNKSVGGINAQSFALENISGNIANSGTTAFKRTDTSFSDLVQGGTSQVSNMAAGNVKASARSTIGIQGSIEGSDVETYMGIKGNGFFVVGQKAGEVDGSTTFASGNAYTRRGDFSLDKEGYLVNGAGYYLAGLAVDSSTNNPIGDTPEILKIDKSPIAAEATTTISYNLNLPSEPDLTSGATDGVWANHSAGDDGIVYSSDTATDESEEFLANSISGGAVTAYDAQGNAINVQMRWVKIQTATDTTGTGTDQWELYYQSNSSPADGDTAWTKVDVSATGASNFEFDDTGALTSPTDTSFDLVDSSGTGITVNGKALDGITMDFGTGGLTQYADTGGTASVRSLTQDGYPVGDFSDVSISDGGRVVANYSNGKSVDLYQIPLVSFQGESMLKPIDGEAYTETKESGHSENLATGSIVGSSLESSNVDISEEFTKLIVTQQAFSANSKVITSADQMMTDILNIIR